MIVGALLALGIGAAPPPVDPASEIESIDRTEDLPAAEAQTLEAHVVHVAAAGAPVTLPIGETAFFEAIVPFEGAVALPPIVSGAKASKGGLAVLPVVTVESSGKKGAVVLRYAIRNQGATGSIKVDLRFELTPANPPPNKLAATLHEVSLLVNCAPPIADAVDIELDRRAYVHFQNEALTAYEALPKLHDYLRLDRVDRPPSSSRVEAKLQPILDRFVRARLYADVARSRLRAAAEIEDEALSRAAIFAIGGLSKKPTGTAKKARAIEGLTTAEALAKTREALEDLQIDAAEGFLDKLRNSGKLNRAELVQALELQGAIDSMRGRSDLSAVAYGRALCLDPEHQGTLKRSFFAGPFEVAKRARRCEKPIAITGTEAKRIVTAEGMKIDVVASFAPDPFKLVSGGEIQIWGSGGEVHSAERIRTSDDGAHLEATFNDTGDLENYAGQILIKVAVRDLSGVPIATLGDPDPVPLSIGGESPGEPGLPWWVWLIAGTVAVAGATTATVLIATSGGDPTHGLGPIQVTF